MKNPGGKSQEPAPLHAALAEYVARQEPGSRLHSLGVELLKSHGRTRERRAAVLAHPDLAGRLVDELGYDRPEQWNGYIPPSMWNLGDDAFCRSAYTARRGEVRFTFGQLGHRALGEMPNDSHRRTVLLEISQEAWNRQHPAPEGPTHATNP